MLQVEVRLNQMRVAGQTQQSTKADSDNKIGEAKIFKQMITQTTFHGTSPGKACCLKQDLLGT